MSEPTTETRTVEDLLAENALLQRKVDNLKSELKRSDDEYEAAIAERDRALETLAFQERTTLPELRRAVEHHKDGKQRWRERAEKAEREREAIPALLASIKEYRALNPPLVEALQLVYRSMKDCAGDEWAMEWLGEVWTQVPLNVRAAAGDPDAAAELAEAVTS